MNICLPVDVSRTIESLVIGMLFMFTVPLDTMAGDPEHHHIARGRLLDVRDTRLFAQARYHIKEVIFGEIPHEIIEVGFYPMALKGDLPVEAVLILGSIFKEGPPYTALGADPALGILPDTPENRARATSLTEEDLNRGNPAEKQISETMARSVIEQFLAENNLLGKGIIELWRSPYGWRASWASDSYPAILFYVGDDGGLKCANHSGGGEVKPYQEEPAPIPESLPGWPAGSYKVEEVDLEYAVLRATRENPTIAPSYNEPVQYRVIERLKGSFDPSVQVVEIDKAADAFIQYAKGNHADALFPHEAILIVFYVSEPSVVSPVDTLASRGILPATPENLQRVKAATLDSLISNPKEKQISLSEAAAIMKRHLTARDLWPPEGTWEMNRLGFGWCFINASNGFVALYVGDDGEVKYHFDERDMPE